MNKPVPCADNRSGGLRIIISPAKKMREDFDTIPWNSLPCFIEQAEILYRKLQSMSREELKKLWRCNDSIVEQNLERLQTGDLRRRLTPALLAYEGIQYQYMAPGVFTQEEFAYVQEHLRILSGLYGVLRPFDGVRPYRLEMQAKLETSHGKDLYSFWGSLIAEEICRDADCIINLASQEYARCVSRHLPPGKRMVTCVFGQEQGGRIVEKGTLCKMARGEMVRYLAQERAETPEALRGFSRLNYVFSHACGDTYVFLTAGRP